MIERLHALRYSRWWEYKGEHKVILSLYAGTLSLGICKPERDEFLWSRPHAHIIQRAYLLCQSRNCLEGKPSREVRSGRQEVNDSSPRNQVSISFLRVLCKPPRHHWTASPALTTPTCSFTLTPSLKFSDLGLSKDCSTWDHFAQGNEYLNASCVPGTVFGVGIVKFGEKLPLPWSEEHKVRFTCR